MKTIAFFPEGAFGPALNSVGIAQACREQGHRAVFICDPGFRGVFSEYGFEEFEVNLSEPMPPEQAANYWSDFIQQHIPNFHKSAYDQIDNYVKDCWEAIVDTAKWAQKGLPEVLNEIKPDLICVDNVILFPAIKQSGVPWVRIVSCSENEVADDNIAPYLSGCRENDAAGQERFRRRYQEVLKPIHDEFNNFLIQCGEAPYPLANFVEESPYMNLLLYPESAKFNRSKPLDPNRFQYLEGCVREDSPFEVPAFEVNSESPLIYVSFGTLGSSDIQLMQRLIDVLGKLPYRVLLNVGDYIEQYKNVPKNIYIAAWYPQPSVIPHVDMVIHHGGNNSFTECLYFGKPALIMPYVWDGHDNATRVQETNHGLSLHRYNWTDEQMESSLQRLLDDLTIQDTLKKSSEHMQRQDGPAKAARILTQILEQSSNT
ncbi:glycosyltransferase [Porticoccaceae bacterium]|jgi:MGT family glycosyltransferase|nr:glycosyltransferase [Porticoccaceae bacterium]MBT7562813.1 glycosyltransferase [Pseudomonadota bacterium]MDB2383106.1 glycosyltransferase [Porticoccaceae bacterium]MDB2565622.1 glycosyltransferase [Porticoccaceae bacterium]MDB2621401.1 glycosyltransferase [Porticoccaceae bacterium]